MQACQTLFKSSNSLCFTAEVVEYLGKASMLNKKRRENAALAFACSTHSILIAQGNGDDTGAAGGYPDSISKQEAE